MKPPRLFSLELGRLLKSRLTWLVLLLTDRARVLVLVERVSLFQPAASWLLLSTERRVM